MPFVGVYHHLVDDAFYDNHYKVNIKHVIYPPKASPFMPTGTVVKYKSGNEVYTAQIAKLVNRKRDLETSQTSSESDTSESEIHDKVPILSSQKPKNVQKPEKKSKPKVTLFRVAPGNRVNIMDAKNTESSPSQRSPFKLVTSPVKEDVTAKLRMMLKTQTVSTAFQTTESAFTQNDQTASHRDYGTQTDESFSNFQQIIEKMDLQFSQLKEIIMQQTANCTSPPIISNITPVQYDDQPTCSIYVQPNSAVNQIIRPDSDLSIAEFNQSSPFSIADETPNRTLHSRSLFGMNPANYCPTIRAVPIKSESEVRSEKTALSLFTNACYPERPTFLLRPGPPVGGGELRLLPATLSKIRNDSDSMYRFAQTLSLAVYHSDELMDHSYKKRGDLTKPALSPRRRHLMEHALLDSYGPSNFDRTLSEFRSAVSMSSTNLKTSIGKKLSKTNRGPFPI